MGIGGDGSAATLVEIFNCGKEDAQERDDGFSQYFPQKPDDGIRNEEEEEAVMHAICNFKISFSLRGRRVKKGRKKKGGRDVPATRRWREEGGRDG